MTMADDGARGELAAYFERIGYQGSLEPTLETLRAIYARHAMAIPFENLSPFLGLPVELDTAALMRKLVAGGRGGYCFEQNLLLRHVLLALGYELISLAARVRWNAPEGVVTPRSHMLLLVAIDGQHYVVDAGFGGITLTAPLLLAPGVEQPTTHEPFRLLEHEQHYTLQVGIGGGWRPLYQFDLQPQELVDYQVSNWYISNNPASVFVTGIMAALPAPGRRYALNNTSFAVHHLEGETERRTLTSAGQLRDVLEGTFGIALPGLPGLDQALQGLVERS
jgi:N-hydroxyarylamine O-acetyltransferase